ncbi:hypothetical protein N7451_006621 [Penicillium sp. IBT 35674x]|nr:hypothetical protein N7451_006621 [Penicillium sp. IBT 35674x]
MGHMRANSSDLAIILDHDASLIVPDSVLEILTEDDEGHLLKQVLSRSRNGSRSRFQPKPLVPRAPTVVSRMRDAVQSRHYP